MLDDLGPRSSGRALRPNVVEPDPGCCLPVLQFSTSWCGHCVKMQPDWEKLAKTVHKDFKGCRVVSVDCEKDAEVCQAFGVEGYPTLMLLKVALAMLSRDLLQGHHVGMPCSDVV